MCAYDKYLSHFQTCSDCKGKHANKGDKNITSWLLDSGASVHFTSALSDFALYTEFTDENRPHTQTATTVVPIQGYGTVFVEVESTSKEQKTEVRRIHPVFYMEDLNIRLFSMGQILEGGLNVYGDKTKLVFSEPSTNGGGFIADTISHMKGHT